MIAKQKQKHDFDKRIIDILTDKQTLFSRCRLDLVVPGSSYLEYQYSKGIDMLLV